MRELSPHTYPPYLSPQGTLLLNNIHKAPKAVLPLLKQTVDSFRWVWGEVLAHTCAAGIRIAPLGVVPVLRHAYQFAPPTIAAGGAWRRSWAAPTARTVTPATGDSEPGAGLA